MWRNINSLNLEHHLSSSPVSCVRHIRGDSDGWCFTLHSVYVSVCVREYMHTHTHTFAGTVKSASGVFGLLHLTDSRHGLNRMSGGDAAAVTSSSLPINTRSSIMSPPVPDPILSEAGKTWNQSPNYSPSVQRKCPFQFKVNSFVIVKRR